MTTRESLGNVSIGVMIGLVLGVVLHQATRTLNFVGSAVAEATPCEGEGNSCTCEGDKATETGVCKDGICTECDEDPPDLCCNPLTFLCEERSCTGGICGGNTDGCCPNPGEVCEFVSTDSTTTDDDHYECV